MNRISLAFLSFAVLLSCQPIGTNPAFADNHVTLSDLSPGAELAFWNKIKESGDNADFSTYLQNFPNGMFYDLALVKFQALGGNPSNLRGLPVAVPAEKPADVKPVNTVRKVVKKTNKKIVRKKTKRVATRRATKPACSNSKRLVGNSCRVIVQKVKVAKPKAVRVTKKLPKKKVAPPILRDGIGGGGVGGGGSGGGKAWN